MTRRLIPVLGMAALAAGLTACGTPDPYGANNYPASPTSNTWPYNTPPQQQQAGYVEYGRITNVALVSRGTNASGNSAAGTVIGGVVGGALGNTIGHGGGRGAATILGAVAGAVVGNNIANRQPYNTAGPVYRVWVQTDSGAMRTYDVSSTGDLRPGDRVRIENGVIYLG